MLETRIKQSHNMQIEFLFSHFVPFISVHLQHNNTHSIHLRLINLIILIHTATQLRRPPVEKIKVQLSITGLELVVFEEQRVVEEG